MRLFRSLRFWLWSLAIAVVLVVGFILLVPVIGRKLIISQGTERLGHKVELEEFGFDPIHCAVTLKGFRILEKDGTALVAWKEFYADFEISSLWGDNYHLKQVRLDGFRADVLIRKDGSINLLDLVPKTAETATPNVDSASTKPESTAASAEEKAKLAAAEKAKESKNSAAAAAAKPAKGILVSLFELKNASAHVKDLARSKPFEREIGPISVVLEDVGTVQNKAGKGTLKLQIGGVENISWEGKLQANPLRSEGHLVIQGFDVAHYAPYYESLVKAHLQSALVDLSLDYVFDPASDSFAKVNNLDVLVSQVVLMDPYKDKPFFSLASLHVGGAQAVYATQQVQIAELSLKGLNFNAERLADGSIDVLALVQPQTASTDLGGAPKEKATPTATSGANSVANGQTAAVSPVGKPWDIRLAKFVLDEGKVAFTDSTVSPAGHVSLDQLHVEVSDIRWPQLGKVGLQLGFDFQQTGQVALKGDVNLATLEGKLHVKNTKLPLGGFEAYLRPFAKVKKLAGQFSCEGDVQFALPQGAPQVHWTGSVLVENIDFTGIKADELSYAEPYVRFSRLAVDDIDFDLGKLETTIGKVSWSGAKIHSTLLPGYAVDWLKLLPAPASPASSKATVPPKTPVVAVTAAASTPAPQFQFKVKTIELDNIVFKTDDYTGGLRFNPTFNLTLGGSIAGISSDQLAHADVDLKGNFDGAPISITGKINPLSKAVYSQLKIACGGFELPAVSPYAERYIGYQIAQGKLVVNVSGKLSEDILEVDNHIVLDQFYLGQEVSSPDAVKLPVKLGLALLRDRHGRIDIDIPVRGNLKDPDFKYGHFVWQTVGNLLTKAALSPFTMLGSLFGDGADLSQVEFDSGSAELGKDSLKRLDGLAKALTERPGLSLEVLPQGLASLDDAGLRERLFSDKLHEWRLDELRKAKPDAILEKDAIIPAVDQERLIKAAYQKLLKERSEQAKLAAKQGTNPASAGSPVVTGNAGGAGSQIKVVDKKPGLAKRVWDTMTLKNWRQAHSSKSATSAKLTADTSTGGSSLVTGPTPASDKPMKATDGSTGSGNASTAVAQTDKGVKNAKAVPLTLEEMRADLMQTLVVSAEDYRRLTHRRAVRIQTYLVNEKKIDAGRVFLLENDPSDVLPKGNRPIVSFKLQ